LDTGIGAIRGINHLLDALPTAKSQRLARSLTPVFLPIKTVLFEPGRTIESVFFPVTAVISLVTPLGDGTAVAVATVGNEGVVGVPLVRGGSLTVRATSQVGGWVVRMDAGQFLDELDRSGPVRELVNDYLKALFGQISQIAACNQLHSLEERLSRWLLMSHDRAGRDVFDITHESLGQLLGVRTVTVTLCAGKLEAGGLIKHHYGQVTIVDRGGLESVACECYGVIRSELGRVAQKAHGRQDPAADLVLPGRGHRSRRLGAAPVSVG
jgi:CRP-like cAMP-binding protein